MPSKPIFTSVIEVTPFLAQVSSSDFVIGREALEMSGCWVPTPAQNRRNPPPVPVAELAEAVAFLEWLLENHFTFLGLREIAYRMTPEGLAGEIRAESGLGILRVTADGREAG